MWAALQNGSLFICCFLPVLKIDDTNDVHTAFKSRVTCFEFVRCFFLPPLSSLLSGCKWHNGLISLSLQVRLWSRGQLCFWASSSPSPPVTSTRSTPWSQWSEHGLSSRAAGGEGSKSALFPTYVTLWPRLLARRSEWLICTQRLGIIFFFIWLIYEMLVHKI